MNKNERNKKQWQIEMIASFDLRVRPLASVMCLALAFIRRLLST